MNPQLQLRFKKLFYGLVSVKQFWALATTLLLWFDKVPAEIWSVVIMFVLGARSFEKSKGVSYVVPEKE